MLDMKTKDQITGQETAGHEITGQGLMLALASHLTMQNVVQCLNSVNN